MTEKIKIMIVDDDPTNVEIVTEILEENYQLKSVFSGEEALETVFEYQPDILLLDIMMPGIDGYEVCKIVKADERLPNILILLVSAKAMATEMEKGFEAGADDYITKPFEHDDLEDKIRDIANKKNRSA